MKKIIVLSLVLVGFTSTALANDFLVEKGGNLKDRQIRKVDDRSKEMRKPMDRNELKSRIKQKGDFGPNRVNEGPMKMEEGSKDIRKLQQGSNSGIIDMRKPKSGIDSDRKSGLMNDGKPNFKGEKKQFESIKIKDPQRLEKFKQMIVVKKQMLEGFETKLTKIYELSGKIGYDTRRMGGLLNHIKKAKHHADTIINDLDDGELNYSREGLKRSNHEIMMIMKHFKNEINNLKMFIMKKYYNK